MRKSFPRGEICMYGGLAELLGSTELGPFNLVAVTLVSFRDASVMTVISTERRSCDVTRGLTVT